MRLIVVALAALFLVSCSSGSGPDESDDFGLFGKTSPFSTSGRPARGDGMAISGNADSGNMRFSYTDLGSDASSGMNRMRGGACRDFR